MKKFLWIFLLLIFAIKISTVSAMENPFLKNLQENFTKSINAKNGNSENISLLPKIATNEKENLEKKFSIAENILSGSINVFDKKIQPYFFITIPNGSVLKISVDEGFVENNFVKNFSEISFSIPLYDIGDYTVELLDEKWFIFYKQHLSFWENIIAKNSNNSSKKLLQKNAIIEAENLAKIFAEKNLAEINDIRKTLWYSELIFDETLTKIAEQKVADMLEKNYIWHISPDNKKIFDFAKNFPKQFLRLGENVAGGRNTSFEKLAEWIIDSPAHRYNLVFPAWRKVGFASVEKDGNYYFVQIFSD